MNNNLLRYASAFLLLCSIGGNVFATNGTMPHGTGTKSKGMGGAGIALPQDAMITAMNPAGAVWVGQSYEMGFEVFMPYRQVTEHDTTSSLGPLNGFLLPGTYESDTNVFLIPHGAANWRIDNDKSFSISVYGAGGMNTDYPTSPWNGGSGSTGIDLQQLFITPTFSFKVGDKTSFGVSAVVAVQGFEAKGLGPFTGFSQSSGNSEFMTDNGMDLSYGVGVRLGFQTALSSNLTFAGAYTSKIDMTEFDDYRDLFANNGDLDIAATLTVGLAYKLSNASVIVFDIQHVQYSDVPAFANSITNLGNCNALGFSPISGSAQSCFGGSNGPGFGWDDMTVYKLGYQWRGKKGWTYRVGYSHTDNPVKETSLNALAPAVVEDHYTFGFTKKTGPDSELNFAVMYAPENSVRAKSALGQPDDVELKMEQFDLEVSWSKRFD